MSAYGAATVTAFAIVALVRKSGVEATHLSEWAGLGRRNPLIAGVFGFLMLSFAGIPLTAGFTSKFALFALVNSGLILLVQAVQAGQAHIADHQRGLGHGQLGQGGFSGFGGADLVAGGAQAHGQQAQQVGVVVHQRHLGAVDVDRDDAPTLGDDPLRAGQTDAAAGTGDDDALPVEAARRDAFDPQPGRLRQLPTVRGAQEIVDD